MSWCGIPFDVWTQSINRRLALRAGAFDTDFKGCDLRADVVY
jgi:hypothetical protein